MFMQTTSHKYSIEAIAPTARMTSIELANWFALCNALKFINHHSNQKDIEIAEKDINNGPIISYISSISGDIQASLKLKGGVPLKYSLDPIHEESKMMEEVSFFS